MTGFFITELLRTFNVLEHSKRGRSSQTSLIVNTFAFLTIATCETSVAWNGLGEIRWSPRAVVFFLSEALKSASLKNSDNLMTASPHHELFTSYQKCTFQR